MPQPAYKMLLALALITTINACENSDAPASPNAEPAVVNLSEQINQYIEPYVTARDFAGAILVAQGNDVIYENSFGLANLASGTKNQINTVFEIGSISKTFTAAAILLLKNDGKLDLDDPISDYWDGHPRAQDITIQNLLLYQAGIPDETAFPNYLQKREQNLTLSEYAEWIATQPLIYEPGTDGSYNNFSYLLLAHLVSEITGQDFGDYLANNIFTPLSLNTIHINKATVETTNKATGYSPGPPPSLLRVHPSDPPAINTGSGNLLASAKDLDRWLQAINNKLLFDLSAEAYPYGWGVREYFDRRAIEQTGIISGFSSGVLLFPDEDLRIVFLSNIRTGKFFKTLHIDLAAIALGESYEKPELINYSSNVPNGTEYAGTYIFPGVSSIEILPKNNLLHFEWQKFKLSTYLYPMGDDQFYNRMDDVIVQFDRDEIGSIKALIWSPGDNQIINPKQM